jgi:glycosyltransferase involved in cell wall biosynthesis
VILLTGWHFLGLVQVHLAARLQRIPILLRMDSNGARPRPWLLRQIYRILFRGVALGLPVGQANARWYHSHGVGDDRLIPSPHYVDNALFAREAAEQRQQRSALRQRWGIPEQAFCFLFAGKLQDKKRPFDLLNALERLQLEAGAAGPSVHLLIVGSGHLEESCRTRVRDRHLPVSFAGFLNQSQIAAAYAASDCLVLASDHGETWGLVVNEAMACGLPAVVSDLVGCGEDLVLEGITGRRYPCGDVAALARCLAAMAADPAAAARMGAAGRERLERQFTIEAAADGIRQAVHRLCPSGSPEPTEPT